MELQEQILLLSITILGILLALWQRHRKKTRDSGFSFDYSYMPYERRNLLTRTERQFYTLLARGCREHNLLICPKVRLEDLVYVTDKNNRAKYRGYVKSRHVDFVLTNEALQPIAAIELDDPSHDSHLAMQIDEFKDHLFETIELPLFRVSTKEDYEEALAEIFEAL